jgi:hypothetical protein
MSGVGEGVGDEGGAGEAGGDAVVVFPDQLGEAFSGKVTESRSPLPGRIPKTIASE